MNDGKEIERSDMELTALSGNAGGWTGRRGFLGRAGALAAGAAVVATLGSSQDAMAQQPGAGRPRRKDIDILKFLAAAELVEDDLWQQYCELAVNNNGFHDALSAIDPALPRYICDDRDDERSHAQLINGYLVSIGEQPVNLDPFRTLNSSSAVGAERRGRLTNLRTLNVDTSWYNRYRGAGNPDFGDVFPQLVEIVNRPTIPINRRMNTRQLQTVAHSAAFHFCAIEQGGSSLYNRLVTQVQHPDVRAIVAAIGPTEVYHFATFHKSLEDLFGFNSGDGLVFPDLRSNPELSHAVMPEPCKFLRDGLPLCSVIRPRSRENAGPLAAATGLVNSGLFRGQPRGFFDAVVALATAAD